ncbi:MAG: exodeoxyribonuclease V subunit gamma [Marmoricola sp.]
MSFLLHRAPGSDQLADGLAELLRDPLPDPFAQELVLVPAKGIERWLSQRLSHRLGHGEGRQDGVCAGVQFRSPHSLVSELTGARDHDPWTPDALVWPLLTVLDAAVGESWCSALGAHLGHGQVGEDADLRRGRRYSVARRLAGLFGSYAVQRPTLLEDWEAGGCSDGAGLPLEDDLAWQPELWRRIVAEVAVPSPAQRHAETVDRILQRPGSLDLPSRFSLFGHTRIPCTEVALLRALGESRDVHLWLPHPSAQLWDQLEDLTGAVPRAEDVSHERVAHPLLASLGRDVRELQRTLGDAGGATGATPHGGSLDSDDSTRGEGVTLLARLQADLAANRVPDPGSRTARPGDRSVQVHSCHGAARQVEVLREVLLGLLADDPTLEPRDILVMCPDIEAYAPLITAAFGMSAAGGDPRSHHPGHQLRVMLADRSLTQTNPLLAVVGQMLSIAGGRAEGSRILDLLATDPVRHRFGFSENDLETITGWVEQAGIRWSFDEHHREEFGLQDYVQNTWRFGLDRILAGVAVSDDAGRFFETTLPLDDVASTSIDVAGRLAEFIDRLQRITDALTGEHPVNHWLETISEGVEQLTAVARGEEWQLGQLHRELAGLATDPAADGLDLRLSDVRTLMEERLAGRPTRANFRTGTLTICTMTPMRSVPHRVVCLLGVDDGVFPRAGAVDGDDVLARRPLTGERDPRSEDRQLMLDAIVAARETLVITYTGATETTGLPRPPAVPLQELLDALEGTVEGAVEAVVREHPLQAFDARNLDPASPFSFDRQSLAGARAAARPRVPVQAIRDQVLPARVTDVALEDLVAFLKNPVKEFLRRRLDVTFLDEGEDALDGIPVELDGLQSWGVGDRLLRDLLAGRAPEAALAKEWRRGVLPPGRLGWRMANDLLAQAVPVADLAETLRAGRRAEARDVSIDLGGGRALTGTVTDLYGERLVRSSFSRVGPKHWLDAWVPLLALTASRPGRGFSAGAVGRGAKGRGGEPDELTGRVVWAGPADAVSLVTDLVAIYDAGMREPLPLPLKAGHEWALRHRSPQAARIKSAEFKWKSGNYPGEDADPEQVMVWGRGCALETLLQQVPRPGEEIDGETTRLGALARRLWVPMIEKVHR